MNNKKGFVKILLAIITIVAVALFVYTRMGYKTELIPNNNTDIETNSKSQNNEKEFTAGWKTYKNEEYGYEFKYPSQWKIVEESRTDKSLSVIISEDGINRFDVLVHDPIADVDGRKVILNEYLLLYSYNSNYLQKNKSVGDIQMLYFESTFNNERKNKSFRYIIPVRQDLMYEFILSSNDGNDIVSFEKIISTFRFTK